MRRVSHDLLAPVVDVCDAMHEAVAHRGGSIGLGVTLHAGVVAEQLEAAPIDLAKPTLDWHLPARMIVKESADDPHRDRLAGGRHCRQGRGRKSARQNSASHGAITLLQKPVVAALISEIKWRLIRETVDQIAGYASGIDVVA